MLIFSFFIPAVEADAVLAPALLAAPEVAALLAKLAISAGVTVATIDSLNYAVNTIWDQIDEDTQQGLYDAAYGGKWVDDAINSVGGGDGGDGGLKYVIGVTAGLFATIKAVIDDLWDVGGNEYENSVDVTMPTLNTYVTITNMVINRVTVQGWIFRCTVSDGVLTFYTYYSAGNESTNIYTGVSTYRVYDTGTSGLYRIAFYNSGGTMLLDTILS